MDFALLDRACAPPAASLMLRLDAGISSVTNRPVSDRPVSDRPVSDMRSKPDATASVRTILGIRTCDSGIQGPENLILAMTERLAERGVRYVVANFWDGDPPTVALHEELVRRGFESHVLSTSFGMSPAIIWKLAGLVKRIGPQVLHTHDIKAEFAAMVSARLYRRPLIGSFYGRLAVHSTLLKWADICRFYAFRRFDRVLANSEAQRSELLQFRVPENRIELLPSCVDANKIQPPSESERSEARRRLNLTESQLVLATIARLSQNKGHTYMLRALPKILAEFPNTVYLVPGEGDLAWRGEGGLRGQLEAEAVSLGIHDSVRFLGYYPDLKTILHATDAIVSPSLLEGMQVALLESMAAGRPIVATAIGGTPDAVVHDVTGILVPPADPDALAEAVRSLLGNPAAMQRMGAEARSRVEQRFDAGIVASQLLEAATIACQRR